MDAILNSFPSLVDPIRPRRSLRASLPRGQSAM